VCGEVSSLCSFLFASRRRHTRLVSDWSSDVCSSDLWGRSGSWPRDHALPAALKLAALALAEEEGRDPLARPSRLALIEAALMIRSEERRVGKEWRSRWSPYQ